MYVLINFHVAASLHAGMCLLFHIALNFLRRCLNIAYYANTNGTTLYWSGNRMYSHNYLRGINFRDTDCCICIQ